MKPTIHHASLGVVSLLASLWVPLLSPPSIARAEENELPPPAPASTSAGAQSAGTTTRTSSSGAGVSVRVEGGVGSGATTVTSAPASPPSAPPPRDDRDLRDARIVDSPSSASMEKSGADLSSERLLQGFRLGYSYVANSTVPVKTFDGQSIADRVGMRTPSSFLIGYEAFYRMAGHSWLNVILVGNVMIGGLEQSKFFPTANALLGFELNNSFQVGVGVNLAPLKETYAHTIFAAGWTPRVGSFYVPIHFFFVPDVDGNHRMGVTTGVTW